MEAVVEVMSRAGCTACARAHQELTVILADYDLTPVVVDVDQRAAEGDKFPRAEYGDRVPVVVLNGREHSYWEVDERRLRADLDALRQ
ncbi:MAG: glutaredoxin family protein [Gordonia sp. (in: high G+C Gram-positive bacteria)]